MITSRPPCCQTSFRHALGKRSKKKTALTQQKPSTHTSSTLQETLSEAPAAGPSHLAVYQEAAWLRSFQADERLFVSYAIRKPPVESFPAPSVLSSSLLLLEAGAISCAIASHRSLRAFACTGVLYVRRALFPQNPAISACGDTRVRAAFAGDGVALSLRRSCAQCITATTPTMGAG